MQKKTGTQVASAEAEQYFLKNSPTLSGAATVDADDLKAALEDFIPPSYPTEIELQDLAAVMECTSRSLLPEKFRKLDRAEIVRPPGQCLLHDVRQEAAGTGRGPLGNLGAGPSCTGIIPARIDILIQRGLWNDSPGATSLRSTST